MTYKVGDTVRVVKWNPEDVDYKILIHRVGEVIELYTNFIEVYIPQVGYFLFYDDEIEVVQ